VTNHLHDIIAIVIVLCSALYALRSLLPQTLLARVTGNTLLRKKNCGGCDGCGSVKKSDDKGCH